MSIDSSNDLKALEIVMKDQESLRRWKSEAVALGLTRTVFFLSMAESHILQRISAVRASNKTGARPSPFVYVMQ